MDVQCRQRLSSAFGLKDMNLRTIFDATVFAISAMGMGMVMGMIVSDHASKGLAELGGWMKQQHVGVKSSDTKYIISAIDRTNEGDGDGDGDGDRDGDGDGDGDGPHRNR